MTVSRSTLTIALLLGIVPALVWDAAGQTPTPGAGPSVISGRVRAADTGTPLSGFWLRLESTRNRNDFVNATTGLDGTYVLENLATGEYVLTASGMGDYVSMNYGQTAPFGPGRTIELTGDDVLSGIDFALIRKGTISGRVTDADGDAVAGATVQALRASYLDDESVLSIAGSATSDADGRYEIIQLIPAPYYVVLRPAEAGIIGFRMAVGPEGESGLRMAVTSPLPHAAGPDAPSPEAVYLATYFPSETNPDFVRPLELAAGIELVNIDIERAAEVPSWHIRGIVIDSRTNEPVAGAQMALVPTSAGADATGWWIETGDDGRFDIAGVVAGPYHLTAGHGELGASMALPLTLGDEDIDDLTLTLDAGYDIPIRVTMVDRTGASRAGDRGMLSPRLVRRTRRLGMPGPSPQPTGTPSLNLLTGRAMVMESVRPGEYGISIAGETPGWYVESVRMGSRNVLVEGIQIDGPITQTLDFVIERRSGSVEGVVRDASRDPAPQAIVVLAPNRQGDFRQDLLAIGRPDPDGRFRFEGVAPGDYLLYAWDWVEEGLWRSSAFLAKDRALAEPVFVDVDSLVTVETIVIPAGR